MKRLLLTTFVIMVILFSSTQVAQAATDLEYFQQGCDQFNAGSYEEALQNFEEAIKLKPQESIYYDWLGACLYHMVALDEALIAFDKALALEPYYSTYEYKGVCLAIMGRTEEALTAFDNSIALHPYLNNYFWKACVLMDLQRYEEAADAYLAVVTLNDADDESKAQAYNNAGYVLCLGKDYAKAMTAVENGLALIKNKPTLYKNKGLILEGQQNYKEALACYEQALEIDPENDSAGTARRNLVLKLNNCLDLSEFVAWKEIKQDVPLNKSWTITFNSPVDLAAAQESIVLGDELGNRLSLDIQAGNEAHELTVSLQGQQTYAPGKSYFLFIPLSVKSDKGIPLNNSLMMEFKTTGIEDGSENINLN